MEKLYSSRENRDAAVVKLRGEGKTVRVGTIRNQQLHPMYVEDLPDGNTGFGNTEYRTFHAVLYTYTVVENRETSGVGWPE